MATLQHNVCLKPWNTFGIAVFAESYLRLESLCDLETLHSLAQQQPVLVLGGGSNVLFTKDVEALVVHNHLGGIRIVSRDRDTAVVEAGAGVPWHDLVTFCLEHNLGGLENLSFIPGRVGASPIQNLGAYGAEVKDVFESLEAMEWATGALRTFRSEECAFGYRDSVFKRALKGKVLILSVRFRLTTRHHKVNIEYGALKEELARRGIIHPTPRDVSEAVIALRRRTLPDPAQLGNAGSFFKNPQVSERTYRTLKQEYPHLVAYPIPGGWKLSAGWLIEQCGWKGKRLGRAGVHTHHALVLVNYGGATGQEILDLAQAIQDSVVQRFGVHLEPEVDVV